MGSRAKAPATGQGRAAQRPSASSAAPAGRARRGAQRGAQRAPLTRERVLEAALVLADREGLDALSMRTLARSLGVEAMSLYKHVARKEEILDGLIDLVLREMTVPPADRPWRDALIVRATSAREVLLRHRWAAPLIESNVTPFPARLHLHNATLGVLRAAGFSVEGAFRAYHLLDSYVYGYVMQELWWPHTTAERPAVLEELEPAIPEALYPHLRATLAFVAARSIAAVRPEDARAQADDDFAFGLALILDGLERARVDARAR